MNYIHPSVMTNINLPPLFESLEQQIYCSIEKLKDDFLYGEYTTRTEAAFHYTMKQLNESIRANWGVESAINGYMYMNKIEIWTRSDL